jgi:hypothetical protein
MVISLVLVLVLDSYSEFPGAFLLYCTISCCWKQVALELTKKAAVVSVVPHSAMEVELGADR